MAKKNKSQVIITCDAKTALKVTEMLRQKIEGIKREMKSLDVTTKAGAKRQKELEKELFAYNSAQQENISNYTRMQKAIKNLSTTSLKDLKRALSSARTELGKLSESDKRLPMVQQRVKTLQEQVDKLSGAAKKQGGAWNTALKNLTAYVGLFAVFNQAKQYFTDLFKLNTQYGEQLTNIRKVALFTNDEVAKLSKELSRLDTRTSLEELNKIAYAGAKLGIQTKGGTDALAGFVRAADQVNVALKEDLGDEALTALAKITEVMGLVDKLGVEQAMLKTGSSIFRLASTSTATSGKIVDFSNRMLALGESAALTTPDILALGAAVDSMALEPEVAATAFGKLVVELRKGTSSIEKDLGLATGSLKNMIETGKGMEAIQTIFRAMHEQDNVFALNGLFKDLGSDGARLVKTMVTMAEKSDMLDRAVQESNKAFADGTAVTVEYNMQQETAAAYMERAANLWEKQFVSANEAQGPIRDLAKAWFELSDELVHNATFMTEVKVAVTMLFTSIKAILGVLPALITAVGTAGLAGAFTKLMVAAQAAGVSGLTFKGVLDLVIARYKALNTVMKAGVWGGFIGLMGLAIAKAVQWTASLNKMAAGQRVLNEVEEEGKRRAMEEQESLKRLHNVMNDTTASMDLRVDAMNKLNSAIPNLNAKINAETGAVEENTKAWEDNFKRLQDYYELQGAREKLADIGRRKVNAILDLQKKEEAYANTNVDIPTGPVTSGGAVMGGQAQGAIGQAGQKAAAERERDAAQRILDGIEAEEEALRKKYGARLDADGKPVGGGKPVGDGDSGDATAPEDDARANISEFITKIRNFYERQMTATMEDLTAKGVEKELQDQAVHQIQQRMNAALAAAKQAIVLGGKTWDEFKSSMDADLKEKADEYGQSQSLMLKDAVQRENVAKLRADLLAQMPKIKKGQVVGMKSDERDRAYLDRLWLEASKSENKEASIDQKRMEQRRKELLEHNYTGAVQQNSFIGLINAGFADVSLDDLETDKNAVIDLLEKARIDIVELFQTDGDKQSLLTFLFGEDYKEKTPRQFAELLDMSEDDIKLFYRKLVQYNDEYEQAQKKEDDERKKINDYVWSKTGFMRAYDVAMPAMEQDTAINGKYRDAGEHLGFSNIGDDDPELNLLRARMEMAQEYYDFIEQHHATEQQLAEARKGIMQSQAEYAAKVTSDLFEQYNNLLSLMKPLEQFGDSVGEAFATMIHDSKEGKKAVRDAAKQMLKQFATNTLQIISQQQVERANTTAHYTQLLAMREAFGSAEVQAQIANGTELLMAQMAVNQSEEQQEGVHQQVMAALKSAGIFGWCVSTLGPIAGPIAYSAMMATLMGLLSFAINLIGGGKGKAADAKGPNTKLVSGMLTYDSGNVGELKPFFDKDGNMYWAEDKSDSRNQGVNLLTQPTATTINGQPSLVAEQGPELVIGRETTRAIMQDNPALLKALYQYDRHHSGRNAYDQGNVSQLTPPTSIAGEGQGRGSVTDIALLAAVNALLERLNEPISAKIDMYGRGNLYDSMEKASQFMKNKK